MLVSSPSMNAASETPAAITQGLTRGFAGVIGEGGRSMLFGAAAIASPQGLWMASYPHRRFHRHSGAQAKVRILAKVEANPHRQSLHDLDVIAGGVFWGQ